MALINACGGTTTRTVTTTVTGPTITKVVETQKALTKLNVNGKTYELELKPQWLLVKVLRDILNMTGTKVACDDGACGSCTVLMDGIPVLSCMMLAIEVEGKKILTIESLANDLTLHPIQQAWLEEHGAQCGFCTSGMIMTAKALLDRNPNPTTENIKSALSGNICICSNYEMIVKSVLVAAKKMKGGL
jgi:carbon-monoxide dehydrogenase small subunit